VSTGIAIVVALGLFALTAGGQGIDKGGLSGTVFSAGATVPNLSQAFVATIPDNRAFVLTQVCTTHPNALRLQAGAVIGEIPLESTHNCTVYVPGIAIPPKTNINCFDRAGAGGKLRCMVTGVLTTVQ
jgi:hypothetical protein